jgi:hypothetical protein
MASLMILGVGPSALATQGNDAPLVTEEAVLVYDPKQIPEVKSGLDHLSVKSLLDLIKIDSGVNRVVQEVQFPIGLRLDLQVDAPTNLVGLSPKQTAKLREQGEFNREIYNTAIATLAGMTEEQLETFLEKKRKYLEETLRTIEQLESKRVLGMLIMRKMKPQTKQKLIDAVNNLFIQNAATIVTANTTGTYVYLSSSGGISFGKWLSKLIPGISERIRKGFYRNDAINFGITTFSGEESVTRLFEISRDVENLKLAFTPVLKLFHVSVGLGMFVENRSTALQQETRFNNFYIPVLGNKLSGSHYAGLTTGIGVAFPPGTSFQMYETSTLRRTIVQKVLSSGSCNRAYAN